MFPFSELMNTTQIIEPIDVSNGLSKCYIGNLYQPPRYTIGDTILIYRRYTQNNENKASYKSCITSFCVVTDLFQVKSNGACCVSLDEFKKILIEGGLDVNNIIVD